MLHELPSKCSTRVACWPARFGSAKYPTAYKSDGLKPDIPVKVLNAPKAEFGLGLETTLQLWPSQCSINVSLCCVAKSRMKPAAVTSVGDSAITLVSTF